MALNTYINGLSDLSIRNIRQVESKKQGSDIGQDAAIALNKGLIKSLPRDFGMVEKSIDPDLGAKVVFGDRFDDVFNLVQGGGFRCEDVSKVHF